MKGAWLAAVLGVGSARADAPKPEALKADARGLPYAALRALARGTIAYEARDYIHAAVAFKEGQAAAPQHAALFAYNRAVVLTSQRQIRDAAAAYREYLKLAGSPADRALVERRISELTQQTPFEVRVAGDTTVGTHRDDELDALIVIDGLTTTTDQALLKLGAGLHVIERFTAGTYWRDTMHGYAGDWHARDTWSGAPKPFQGNVVIGAVYNQWWSLDGKPAALINGPIALAVGEHTLRDNDGCSPITFHVRKPDVLTYVRIRKPRDVDPKAQVCDVRLRELALPTRVKP